MHLDSNMCYDANKRKKERKNRVFDHVDWQNLETKMIYPLSFLPFPFSLGVARLLEKGKEKGNNVPFLLDDSCDFILSTRNVEIIVRGVECKRRKKRDCKFNLQYNYS